MGTMMRPGRYGHIARIHDVTAGGLQAVSKQAARTPRQLSMKQTLVMVRYRLNGNTGQFRTDMETAAAGLGATPGLIWALDAESGIRHPRQYLDQQQAAHWGLKLRERIGFKRAAVAVARKPAATMHLCGHRFAP
jgi:hypothetical protein